MMEYNNNCIFSGKRLKNMVNKPKFIRLYPLLDDCRFDKYPSCHLPGGFYFLFTIHILNLDHL